MPTSGSMRRGMPSDEPPLDELERGHVVVAGDTFTERDRRRPYVVASDESHPFHGEQYVGLGLTTRTWYDDRVSRDTGDFVTGEPPRDSSIVPHAVVSLDPDRMYGYVGRIRPAPSNRAVERLVGCLGL